MRAVSACKLSAKAPPEIEISVVANLGSL